MAKHSLTADDRQLVVDTATGIPKILWFGAVVDGDLDAFDALGERPVPNASLDTESPATLLPSEGDGWVGVPGITGRRADGSAWSPRFTPTSTDASVHSVVAVSTDEIAQLTVTSTMTLDESGVAIIAATVRNDGAEDFMLDNLALTIPVPAHYTELQVPEGRWVHEFHEVRIPFRVGATELTNRRGRTSHDKPPWVFVGDAGFTNQRGEVLGAHLGWSGSASMRAEVLTDGRRVIQFGEALIGGEVRLAPGESYESPSLYLSWSASGLNEVSQGFHRYLRARPQHGVARSPRPVHMNTWEAVYFDHDLDTLKRLADAAAAVGAERYVLDDGWFGGRRDDTAGLGDWWVSPDAWPNGLEPLISHVRELGMEFGIWVEPEMVNPDSELFRNHPDWALGTDGYDPVTGRNQLVLNLTRDDVWRYLFDHLNRLLADHDVGYVKWDMNRDLTQPSTGASATSHAQTHAVYRLIDALRAEHPGVDIESCSSGGGRADFAILERTDRVWTSDSNDALERQRIQSGFLRIFPPEIMGSHVGPDRSHTSGRRHGLGFRATTALIGHFGMEWNLLDANGEDLAQLTDVIARHKEHRELLHRGVVYQIDTADPNVMVIGFVEPDRSAALVSIAQLALSRFSVPERLRIPGLDAETRYDVDLIALADSKLGLAGKQPKWTTDGVRNVSGSQLEQVGLQLPVFDPETAFLLKISST